MILRAIYSTEPTVLPALRSGTGPADKRIIGNIPMVYHTKFWPRSVVGTSTLDSTLLSGGAHEWGQSRYLGDVLAVWPIYRV